MPVGTFVRDAHEDGLPALEERAAAAGLSAENLDTILTYCAEHRCDAAALTCPGYQRHVKAQGLDTVDKFVAQGARRIRRR